MEMFRGITAVTVDAKGRISLPAKYREMLTTSLVITIDTEDQCLLLYPLDVWKEIEEKIEALPSFHASTRRIKRLLIGHATECEPDGQFRLLLPTLLREYAGMDKKVMMVGQGKKIELWGETIWHTQCQTWLSSEGSTEDMPEALQDLTV